MIKAVMMLRLPARLRFSEDDKTLTCILTTGSLVALASPIS